MNIININNLIIYIYLIDRIYFPNIKDNREDKFFGRIYGIFVDVNYK